MRLIFLHEEFGRRFVDRERVAQRILALLRASSGQYRDDEQTGRLIADLKRRSLEFARWWPRHEVQGRQDGRKEIIHPQVGLLSPDHSTFQIEGSPGLKLVVYLPAHAETASKLEQLCRLHRPMSFVNKM